MKLDSPRAPSDTHRHVFLVRGMDCAEEIATLQSELEGMAGVRSLAFDLLNRKLTVEAGPDLPRPEPILAAIARTGMTAELWTTRAAETASSETAVRRRAALTVVSGVALTAGFALHAASSGWHAAIGAASSQPIPTIVRGTYLMAALCGAWFVLPKAWIALRRVRPDMNLLMCIAVTGAIGIGEWLEAAVVSFLFAVSLALESWSIGRARRVIESLMALSPTKARVIGPDRNEDMVDAISVPVGSTVVVKPGEKFPLDGCIVRGRTTVNQAPITGESAPVVKEEGSEVFAGTVNEEGAVEVKTVKPFASSTLSQIAKMVGEAHARRSPSEQWVERFARIYTPAVLVIAVLVAFAPPVLGGPWGRWFYEALVLLVIACPCALVISTPISIVSGLVASAREGVLVKGGLYLEVPSRLRAIAFDKTGTLTVGKPRVSLVEPRAGHDERELLWIAASVEAHATHPLARAIVEYARERGISPVPATEFQMLSGKGAHAKVDGVDHWLGSHRYVEERAQETPDLHRDLENLAASGSTVVVIGREDHVCGFIALADELRPRTRESLDELRVAGIERVVMLTGDNRGTAEAVGRAAGVDEVRAELLPQDKVRVMEDLIGAYGTVAMVGDGVNDAPALARSSLGIAMGAAGTDAALETADVALMGDDLSRLGWLVRHSHRTLRTIRQNVVASLVVKAVFLLLALAGQASLWAAIVADMGVSLLVVLNALRLLKSGGRVSRELRL